MANHYHLLVETIRPELSSGMHWINACYGQYFNRRHGCVGHLFQGRFKALLIDKNAYFLAVHRYIHQNPVRAALASRAWDYEWSSCSDFLGLRQSAPWLETRTALDSFSGDENEKRASYARFVEETQENDPSVNAFGQLFLGSHTFIEALRRKAEPIAASSGEYVGRVRFEGRPAADTILAAVSRRFAANARGWAGLRCPARSLAVYLLRDRARLSLRAIAESQGISVSGVSRQVSRMRSRMAIDPRLRVILAQIDKDLAGMSNVKFQDLTP